MPLKKGACKAQIRCNKILLVSSAVSTGIGGCNNCNYIRYDIDKMAM